MSTPPLFFLDYVPLVDVVLLTGDEGRHAGQVLRVRPGEGLNLSDGRGALLGCVVREVRSDGVVLRVEFRTTVPVPRPRLTVVQALPKGERGELAVATMTELGVDAIVPWQASRCVTQWVGARAAKSLDKWRRTAREAAKQSRRPHVPKLAPLMSTAEVTASTRQVAEGVKSCSSLLDLSRRAGVYAPIVEHVQAVVEGKMTAADMLTSLISRDTKPERD